MSSPGFRELGQFGHIFWKAFRKLILGWPYVVSTNWSIFGTTKRSLGHALFKSVKLTQTLHFPFFFFIPTILDNQSRKNTF